MTFYHLTNTDNVAAMFPESEFVRDVGGLLYLLAKDGDPDVDSYHAIWKTLHKDGKCLPPKECEIVVHTDNRDLCSLFGTAFEWAREKCRSICRIQIRGMSLHIEAKWDDDSDSEEEKEPVGPCKEVLHFDSSSDSSDEEKCVPVALGSAKSKIVTKIPAKRPRVNVYALAHILPPTWG